MIPRKLPSKCVYLLRDPDGTPRYVGVTNNPKKRYRQHLLDRPQTKRGKWMGSLARNGKVPSIEILESSPRDWDEAECRWISHYRCMGFKLVNGNDGGKSLSQFSSDETIASNLWHGEQTPIQKIRNKLRQLTRNKHTKSPETTAKVAFKLEEIEKGISRCAKRLGSHRAALDQINVELAIRHPNIFAPKTCREYLANLGHKL